MLKRQAFRIVFSFIGVLLLGTSVGFLRLTDLGTDPFTTFNVGMSNLLNIQFGNFLLILNLLGLVLVALSARYLIGIGTIFNIVLVGYVADFIVYLIRTYFSMTTIVWVRFIIMIISSIVLAIGVSMYIVANRGVAPYDALPIIVEDRTNGNVSFRTTRVISDILCIIIGFMLGARVGIATVISGFLMGPLIQFFRIHFGRMLERIEKESE